MPAFIPNSDIELFDNNLYAPVISLISYVFDNIKILMQLKHIY
jgi:hypothetical protein